MKVKLDVIERKPREQEQVQTWMTKDIWTDSDYQEQTTAVTLEQRKVFLFNRKTRKLKMLEVQQCQSGVCRADVI